MEDRVLLYAGANLPSEEAIAAYAPGLSAYPAMGPSYFKEQPETDLVSRLEEAVSAAACSLFGAEWAEPRLPSCTIANLAAYHAFTKPGELLLAPAADHGGHFSQRSGGTPELAGLAVEDLPFDTKRCRLDAAAAANMIRFRKPALIMLGRSVMIKPDDVSPVVEAARSVGAKTIFDASHVAGLIAGGQYPNPLSFGVDVLTFSTYKTLPGRPHALTVGRDVADAWRLAEIIEGKLLANYDAGKLPSLLVTLREVREDGLRYARHIVETARVLKRALVREGVEVLAAGDAELGTHQILIPLAAQIADGDVMAALEKHSILAGICSDPSMPERRALRIGTQFVARQGYDAEALRSTARSLAKALASCAPS
ncbi:glycine hydroxymethyltransferase [Ensifer sp. ENS07]|uniref:glycine hydroxymethyltransferase n=1 Tax=Ensifer sp. ENS07 TaxID=2769274 RepID=UPI001FF01180|nr:glycine hydroxymethyltransferase [Ensifer sp. ENS07]